MNKLMKLAAALAFVALVFSCRLNPDDSIDGEMEKILGVAGKGKTIVKDVVVTFKNGWENEDKSTLDDDPFTDYQYFKPVSPAKMYAVVNTGELETYNTALTEWKNTKFLWDAYNAELEKYRQDLDSGVIAKDKPPPSPPETELKAEPAKPLATLPCLPGDEYLDENGEPQFTGSKPEWDYRIFKGWTIAGGNGADGDEAAPLELSTTLTKSITVVAKWAKGAPSQPYKTIVFNKADGSGAFESRFAVPTKFVYTNDAGTGASGDSEVQYKSGDGTVKAYETDKYDNAKAAGNKIIEYKAYRIGTSDILGKKIDQTISPTFTRVHWKADGWADRRGNAVDPSKDGFADNTNLYQKWTARTYTLSFDANGHGSAPADISVSAPDAAQGGLKAAGKNLPKIADAIESGNLKYVFKGWTDAVQGGNTVDAETPVSGDLKLYARWAQDGVVPFEFAYTGKSRAWTVPKTGRYKIEAWGAGNDFGDATEHKGAGGYVSGVISLNEGTTLYIYSGGQGVVGGVFGGDTTAGGWNGGGKGSKSPSHGMNGGGGGGASDVRRVKAAGADTAWNHKASLESRIIVAGGGGGKGHSNGTNYYGKGGNGGMGIASGGNGQSNTGSNGETAYANGGTLNEGGTVSNSRSPGTPGTLGLGGDGNAWQNGGGGGGGGYYGGGGGGATGRSHASFGGGGSSWVKTTGDGLKFDAATIYPATGVTGGGAYSGNGKVVITFIP
ncbi:MAG: InlB B-repeat-containing protein [Spirochaetaceae bacterium]|nr:InlB B-repeat-containing protein [Spirochaetaceae bacterium]